MSIVLVKKHKNKIIIGADSQESSGESNQENFNDCKLREINQNITIAGAGNAHVCSLFYAFVENYIEQLENINDSFGLINYFNEFSKWMEDIIQSTQQEVSLLATAPFILIIKDKVWYFNNFYIREIKENEYTAIGSGVQPALACLNLTDDFEQILKSVCKVDIYCSEPIIIKEIKYGD